MNYSNGFRARMVQRMAGPEGLSAFKLAEEIGVHQSTLSRWLRETSREENRERRGEKVKSTQVKERRSVRPDDLLPVEEFRSRHGSLRALPRRARCLPAAYGLHEAQLQEWRQKIEEASLGALGNPKKSRRRKSPEAKRLQQLERELNRKDKALAEVTALLALKKKLETLFGDEDEGTTSRNER